MSDTKRIKYWFMSAAMVLGIAVIMLPGAISQPPTPTIYTVPPPGEPLQFPIRKGPAPNDYTALESPNGVGLTLPNYTLLDSNKHSTPLSRFRGRVLVLDFWGTTCGPCLRAMPHLGKLARSYRSQDVTFMPICETDGDWQGFLRLTGQFRSTGLNFFFDPKAGWSTALDGGGRGLRGLLHNGMGQPAQLIIDRGGRVVGALQGYDDAKDPDMKQLQHSVDMALRPALLAFNVSRLDKAFLSSASRGRG